MTNAEKDILTFRLIRFFSINLRQDKNLSFDDERNIAHFLQSFEIQV